MEAASGLAEKATVNRFSVSRSAVMSCMAPAMVTGLPDGSQETSPMARPTHTWPSARRKRNSTS